MSGTGSSAALLGRRVGGTVSAALDWGVGGSGSGGAIVRLTVVGEAAAIVSSILRCGGGYARAIPQFMPALSDITKCKGAPLGGDCDRLYS